MRTKLLGAIAVLLSPTIGVGTAAGSAGAQTVAHASAGPPSWAASPAGGTPSEPQAGRIVPGHFIVTLEAGEDAEAVAEGYRRDGADVDHVYTAAATGFAGQLTEDEVDRARDDERVLRVEPDRVVVAAETTQGGSTWGLDRLDERPLALDGTYSYDTTASEVTAYVVDTGIRASHVDFGGRVRVGYSGVPDADGTGDCNGHGTHVAGTLGGTTWGVAKAVRLVPVRVLDCAGSGFTSGIIAGLDWITANARKPAVANLSLGGAISPAFDAAVGRTIASGVTVVAAAGNEGADACTRSPARTAAALTVAATDHADTQAPYSNHGTCVDLYAPGSRITSAWHTSDVAAATVSGTSMAAPHVAGVAALHLAAHPAATPASVAAALLANTSSGPVRSAGAGTPNRLLHSRWPTAVTTGTLTGTVRSSRGEVLAGAAVTAGGATATTDHLGAYRLTLAAGPHGVTAAAAGHTAGSSTASVTAGQTTEASFALAAAPAPK